MAISFLSSTGKFNFPRYIPVGVAFYGAGLIVLASDSSHVLLQIASTSITFDFIYYPEFYAPSTNFYTIDHVFNFTASQAYISGVPASSGAFAGWIFTPGEFRPRIWFQPTSFDPTPILIPIPQPASAWYVPP